jgi:hypothetical protein
MKRRKSLWDGFTETIGRELATYNLDLVAIQVATRMIKLTVLHHFIQMYLNVFVASVMYMP